MAFSNENEFYLQVKDFLRFLCKAAELEGEKMKPGLIVHAYNPSIGEAQAERSPEVYEASLI